MNPRDNPKEHKRMKGETDETGESEAQSEENTNPLRDTEQSNGSDGVDISGLHVGLRNETTYYVGNPSSGTAYLVNMNDPDHENEMTCTCPDYRYRGAPDEDRACKHIQAVIAEIPADIQVSHVAYEGLKREYEILSDKVDSVSQQLTGITANAHQDAGTESFSTREGQHVRESEQSVNAADAAGNGEEMSAQSASEAAEKLQTAFDNVVEGFDTQASGGRVWVNKTPQAPETLPGPGNVETFNAFLMNPQQMQYDPDNGPGQYWKNYLEPNDVDEYISEVLE